MRRAVPLGALILALSASAVQAQSSDPYAAGIAKSDQEQLRTDYAAFLDNVRMLYFAVGCKAILVEPYAANAIGNAMPDMIRRGIPSDKLNQQIKIAAREGLAKAGEGCQTWEQAPPQAIASLRRLVEAGVMP